MQLKNVVASILKREGTEYLFCFPSNRLIDAAAAHDIRPILARTERVMVNMAEGYSHVSSGRRIGVCAMQYGPGSENAFPGVAQAYADCAPVLLLPEAFGRRQLGVNPNFQAVESYRSITKWVGLVHTGDRVPQMMRHAFWLLRSGRPGPVAIEIPTDMMSEETSDEPLRYDAVKGSAPMGDPRDVAETMRAMLAAKSPVIIAGQGVLYAEAWSELKAFAELVKVPVITTLNGKSAFPEDHPLSLGTGGRSGPKAVDHFLRRADFVLGIGTSFTRSNYIVPIPPGKTIAQVTIDERDVNKEYPVAYGAIGDAKKVLGQFIDEVTQQLGIEGCGRRSSPAAEIRGVKEEFLREWKPRLTSDEVPISPFRVLWEIMQAVDRRRTIVTHESGSSRDQMVPFYEAVVPHGYLGWGKSTQLGTGLGLAMGAKLAAPDRLVINVMGDAAFGMVGMDFETAVRSGIPILTIVLNNGGMGGYEPHLPVSTARFGLRFLSGDYSKIADALGGYTERVEKPDQLLPALRRAMEEVGAGRPALLEVMTKEDAVYPSYW